MYNVFAVERNFKNILHTSIILYAREIFLSPQATLKYQNGVVYDGLESVSCQNLLL
jgi:hypothetical protein